MPRDEARSHKAPSKPVPKFSFKARADQPQAEADSSPHVRTARRADVHKPVSQAAKVRPPPQTHQQHLPARGRPQDEGYVVDKRGDALIRRYGSNNSREVPDYYRYGAGRVLGADDFIRFERTGTRTEFFFRGHREKGRILSADRKTFRALSGLAGTRPVRVRQARAQDVSASADYLSLRTSGGRSDEIGPNASESRHADETPIYRLLHGEAGSEIDDVDKDDHSDLEMQDYNDDPVTLRSVELGRKVKETPSDMQAWHELVDHQDVLLRHVARDAQHPTPAEIKSFADVKLSLLEKALKHAESAEQREKVQLKLMAEGAKIWDRAVAIRRWEETLEAYPSSQRLWEAQMAYRQADISTFRYDDIKQRYISRIKYLQSAILESAPLPEQAEVCCHLITTFLHATVFVSDAGFVELACSAWQAFLELTFCRPPASSTEDLYAQLQVFWDSEVPRFGEAGSMGWAAFAKDPTQYEPPEPVQLEARSSPSTRDAYKAWAAAERQRMRTAASAARTLDDGAEDDPFRVVLYADFDDLLIWLPRAVAHQVKPVLFNALLAFCCLPPAIDLGVMDGLTTGWPLRRTNGDHLGTHNDGAPEVDQAADVGRRMPDFAQHFQSMTRSPQVLCGHPDWFKYLEPVNNTDQRTVWVVGILKQLVRQLGEAQLASYYLALNSAMTAADDKKTAKALLKHDPTNTDLYLGYSSREHAKGDATSARTIASAALTLPSISEYDRVRLSTWLVWMKMETAPISDAAAEVLRMCLTFSGNYIDPASDQDLVARAHEAGQAMTSRRDYLLSAGNLRHAAAFSEALVLLSYLTAQSGKEQAAPQQGDIWSALACVDAFSTELRRRSGHDGADHEAFLQSSARLLYFHASHGPCRLGLLREHLGKYIDYFPKNTIFQALYTWRETRLSVDDRVRSKLDGIVSQPVLDCISTRAFLIQYEARAGNVNSTAAAFERALENSNQCRHHPQIWTAYIRFCHSHPALRGKAKSVFHRALQRCPWSKDVYMEAFLTLVSELDSSEVKSVYNTMVEKGMRVHLEMEDFVAHWKEQQRDKRQRR
ncbi:NRDE-2, necessary for RNA interference-domain-containing protein [Microdochium trichocladiopsis]|uniref:NRDE-2, necessary for RNA interference-domain-containing protein n=1 Tax=Microdochium trichocladiopsis TaxID=1682393 RepID=A0A9P8YGH4_9PEZI|nr:NRDE-2, necessary for RNA interference-domain-containing protein [Microdochium trichocladiopsis]KAH7041282.1 NRDE-2, necessary for RNA interference-domain-containing protein [Microdochium trichocladiopsis]